MTQLTPRDDIRKQASEILKRVDQLIKGGKIEESMREIIRAREIDPSNVYVHAYEERLAFLQEEHEKNLQKERTRKEAEDAARKRDAELQLQLEEEQTRLREDARRREEERKRQEENRRAEEQRRERERPIASATGAADTSRETTYVEAVKKAWSTGNITPHQALALQELRRQLGISPERQAQIETNVLAELEKRPGAESILVIDDDEQLLVLITRLLELHGYQVTALTTTDEAYVLLKKWKPRLILSDVNLETSTMGGFAFYERVRELQQLEDVPFIFLTGLSDEAIVRAGKELGADDYLTKPVSEQALLSAVKGKLKRFERFRKPP